jgi:hypothetical protein
MIDDIIVAEVDAQWTQPDGDPLAPPRDGAMRRRAARHPMSVRFRAQIVLCRRMKQNYAFNSVPVFLNRYVLAAMDGAEEGEGLAQREAGVEEFLGSSISGLSGHLLVKFEGAHGHNTVAEDLQAACVDSALFSRAI